MADLLTIPDVVASDLSGGAMRQALAQIGSTCFFCRQALGKAPAIAVYLPDERSWENWAIHPYLKNGRIVSPSAFAHIRCALAMDHVQAGVPAAGTYVGRACQTGTGDAY